jgi:hypothetical protein
MNPTGGSGIACQKKYVLPCHQRNIPYLNCKKCASPFSEINDGTVE